MAFEAKHGYIDNNERQSSFEDRHKSSKQQGNDY